MIALKFNMFVYLFDFSSDHFKKIGLQSLNGYSTIQVCIVF